MATVSDVSFDKVKRMSIYFDTYLMKLHDADMAYILYARTAKLAEEIGEVMQAVIGVTADNPRKGFTHNYDDVQAELCDVILTAMCAMFAINRDKGVIAHLINERIRFVDTRLATSGDYCATKE